MTRTVTLASTADILAAGHDPRYFLPEDPALLLKADPGRREPVEFTGNGVRLAGHLYRPPAGGITPGIVMMGPISSVKEQTVPHYAERLADAGYTVLTFDPRTFGESEGTPRAHHDPVWIVEDIIAAVDYLRGRGDIVDPERIGGVGVCMGGGYMVTAAARDRRIGVVASVAGGYDVGGTFTRIMGAEGFASFQRTVIETVERARRAGEVAYMPTIATELTADVPLAAMPNPEAYSYYDRTSKEDAPTWSRTMTVASLVPYLAYSAIGDARILAPTPLLVVHGTRDAALLPEYAQAVYDAAGGPKRLVWVETHNHIELYDQDPYVSLAAGAVVEWLAEHLPVKG
ncbi:alpha/beta hydrolase [Thermostaphylospora chromogena]|uniref:Xaa-Pro dipeptidyl-peptidase-like domain-containing protein n=1 Tax=Thermostaphylospora chromogena TaxID=35622 RepID=A0A1H1E295_9ACTN|nr:alpha/beta hydrolase [Thermostaphylospora chromogena]SDQ82266.1 hypothetical protein SAMN04489764_2258 [Thermostaphylospora chromogena]